MAHAPPPPAAAAAEEEHQQEVVDSDVWLACAMPLSRLPVVGSQVYYFPHGHAEQFTAPPLPPSALPPPHLFPCTVTGVRLGADARTNEVVAEISLQPGPHRSSSSSSSQSQHAGTPINNISYYAKQLTQSDANNGGGFSVPRYCADVIFPRLDFEADPPVQNLVMTDTVGRRWQFRHIYRGTPRRHLLTTGWSKFVNAKLLVAGDTVVFMRRPRRHPAAGHDDELLIGLRRAPPRLIHQAIHSDHQNNVEENNHEEVMEAARLAAEGSPFTVTYCPRVGAGEFVVPRKEVEDALGASAWEPGMLLRMQVTEPEDATRRMDWAQGTLKQLHQNIWRPLEVDWDDDSAPSSSINKSRFVNAWQVQLVGYPTLLKRLRSSAAAMPSIVPSSMPMPMPATNMPPLIVAPQPILPPLVGNDANANGNNSSNGNGMQGARHHDSSSSSPPVLTTKLLFPSPVDDLSAGAGSSEILDPDSGSPPSVSAAVQAKKKRSIQLFGATITPHQEALQTPADGRSSQELNNADDGVLDEQQDA